MLPLGVDMCPHPFLDELEGAFVLGDLEQLHDALLLGGEAAHLLDHVQQELGVFGEAPVVVAVPRFAHILSHLVALVEAHGHGIAEGYGYCSSVVAVEEVSKFFLRFHRIFFFFVDMTLLFVILVVVWHS